MVTHITYVSRLLYLLSLICIPISRVILSFFYLAWIRKGKKKKKNKITVRIHKEGERDGGTERDRKKIKFKKVNELLYFSLIFLYKWY